MTKNEEKILESLIEADFQDLTRSKKRIQRVLYMLRVPKKQICNIHLGPNNYKKVSKNPLVTDTEVFCQALELGKNQAYAELRVFYGILHSENYEYHFKKENEGWEIERRTLTKRG
jgi:hypothetical protein